MKPECFCQTCIDQQEAAKAKQIGRLTVLQAILVPIVLGLAIVVIVLFMSACTSNPTPIIPTPRPDYEATIAVLQADKAACGEGWYQTMGALNDCLQRPMATPKVIVVTPVPPPTATPVPWVSCESANYDWTVVVHTGTTVREWHDDTAQNLGYADIGATGRLIDKSMDADALWWWRAEGIRTGDYPYGEKDGDPLKGWVKAIYSGCVPPIP